MAHIVSPSTARRLAATLCLGAFATACVPPATPDAPGTPTTAPTTTVVAPGTHPQWAQDMLASINAQRAAAGVAALTLCAPLSVAAQAHSADMAANSYFSHTGLDGSSPSQRIGRTSYGRWTAVGENIAAGQSDVASVMNSWINSAGHYANIISPNFTHVGVGHVNKAGSAYRNYWTQNFGAGGTC